MKAYFLVSQRFLKAKGKKKGFASLITLLSILAVLLGVMVSIVVLSVMNGFQEEIKAKILGVKGHITFISKSFQTIKNYAPLAAALRQEPGIVSVVPYLETQALARLGASFTPVVLRGVEANLFQADQELGRLFEMTAGEKQLLTRNTVLIGNELFEGNFLTLNQRIDLLLARGSLKPGLKTKQLRVKLTGVFKTGFQEFDNGIIYTPLATLQKAFKLPDQVDKLDLKVDNIWEMRPVLLNLVRKYGKDYRIFSWEQVNRNFFYALSLEKTIMSFIMGLILLVASFNVMSAQLILVTERKKEIGILKTIGMAPRHIALVFLSQSFVITSVGSVLGALLGTLIALDVKSVILVIEKGLNFFKAGFYFFYSLMVKNPAPFAPLELFPAGVYYIDSIPSDVSLSRAVFFVFMSIVLSLLASLVPSLKAARLKPIEVMRYER